MKCWLCDGIKVQVDNDKLLCGSESAKFALLQTIPNYIWNLLWFVNNDV